MINTVAPGVLGRNRSLSVDGLLRSARICNEVRVDNKVRSSGQKYYYKVRSSGQKYYYY